jgi:transcriptional regulator with XRE-family HTH domain
VPRRNGSTPKGRARRPAPPPPVDVGRVLRVACARKGWSGADLGRALGVSRQRIADVISGRVRPSPAWLERCAVALDISPVELGVPFRVIDLDRPSAELDLVLVDDGPGKPDVLGSPPSGAPRCSGPSASPGTSRSRAPSWCAWCAARPPPGSRCRCGSTCRPWPERSAGAQGGPGHPIPALTGSLLSHRRMRAQSVSVVPGAPAQEKGPGPPRPRPRATVTAPPVIGGGTHVVSAGRRPAHEKPAGPRAPPARDQVQNAPRTLPGRPGR